MGRFSTETESKGDFKQISKGTHVARCFMIIDLGWQTTIFIDEKTGKPKITPQVFANFEVPGEEIDINGIKKPMTIGKFYTNSLHEKANLRQDLDSWGFEIEDDPQTGLAFPFDLAQILEKAGLISVGEKNGKSKVNSVTALPNGMTCPAQFNETVQFWLDEPNWDVFESLPNYFKEKISESKGFKRTELSESATDYVVEKGEDKIPF